MRTRKSMCAHAVLVGCGGMVADKKSAVETRIEARHHASMARPGTHDANVLGKLLNEQALTVPMRITYHNLGCPRFLCGAHGSQRFIAAGERPCGFAAGLRSHHARIRNTSARPLPRNQLIYAPHKLMG